MEKIVQIEYPHGELEGLLKIPSAAQGIVLFVHGSGSSRFSPRNNFVADVLNKGGLATLLIDLLSVKEDEVYQTRFNINLLNDRLKWIIQWMEMQPETKNLSLGLFGSSTGAAAALCTAAELGEKVMAVVSRGGRPDLAMQVLDRVTASTLFIVGEKDFGVVELNQEAFRHLVCQKHFEVIPRATHLFEEPGCLEEVAKLSKNWFQKYLVGRPFKVLGI